MFSRYETINRSLDARGVRVFNMNFPRRRLIFIDDNNSNIVQKCKCVLGSSLVNGIFLPNLLKMSCPSGTVSKKCCETIVQLILAFDIKKLVMMGGTNNLFEKEQPINDGT